MNELSDREIADIFATVKRIECILDRVYDTTSTTISIQDGPEAGQSVSVCCDIYIVDDVFIYHYSICMYTYCRDVSAISMATTIECIANLQHMIR